MAGIVIAVSGKVSEYLVFPIGRQLGYLFCYRSCTDELRSKVQTLGAARYGLQVSVDEARRRGDEINPIVREWLNRVDQITEEAEELMMKSDENKRCLNGWCPNLNLKWRYKLGREACKKAQQVIVEIQEARNFPDVVSLSHVGPPRSLTFKEYEFMESRASTLNKIMDALRDDKTRVIGVWGVGGVGKTTLLKQVAEQVKQEKLFSAQVYVDLSCTREEERTREAISKIQRRIAKKLGLKLEEETRRTLAAELNCVLKKKKILIVLDDIWKEVPLDEVGIPSCIDDDQKVCKVVLASRDEGLLWEEMGAQECFQIRPLQEEEAWGLFKKTSGDFVENNFELRSIAIEVVMECSGLPISIVTIAKALQDESVAVWKNALDDLRSYRSTIFSIGGVVELCYKHLKDDEVKSLFLLCGLLGDGDISMDDLLTYGMGLDLFDHMDSLEKARDKVVSMVNILKASNLLLDVVEDQQMHYHKPLSSYFVEEGGNSFVQMHELVRDVATSIASKDPHQFVVEEDVGFRGWRESGIKQRYYTGMSLKFRRVEEVTEGLVCPKLGFYSLDSYDGFFDIPNPPFRYMKEVSVLSLSGFDFQGLPSSLSFLSNLRTLCLFGRGMLGNIAMVGKLRKLQILSVFGYTIPEFPKEMMQLSDLRMLSLGPRPVAFPRNLISSLSRLEHLCVRHKFSSWESKEEDKGFYYRRREDWFLELKHLSCLRTLDVDIPYSYGLLEDVSFFENLTRYDICIGCLRGPPDDGINTSRRLKFKGLKGPILVKCFSKLLKTTEVLDLSWLDDTEHFVNQLDCDGFLHLKYLFVNQNYSVKYIMNTMTTEMKSVDWPPPDTTFPLLEELNLRKLFDLEAVCYGPIPMRCFANLRILRIESCELMKSILWLPTPTAKGREPILVFPRLRILKLNYLPNIIQFNYRGPSDIQEPFFNQQVSFPSLEYLDISSLNSVEKIWHEEFIADYFDKLKTLSVVSCQKMLRLIPSNMLKKLSSLQSLKIADCNSVEEVFDMEAIHRKEIHDISALQLRELRLKNLKNLKYIWNESPQGLITYQNLKSVQVSHCPSLEIPYPGYVVRRLLQVKELDMDSRAVEEFVAYEDVTKVATMFLFPEVTSLESSCLNKLKCFYLELDSLEWPMLKTLEVESCENLEILASEVDKTVSQPIFLCDKVSFPTLEYLKLSLKLKENQEIQELQVSFRALSNLKILIVENCPFILKAFSSNFMGSLNNLKKLTVKKCDVLEEVFDLKGHDQVEMLSAVEELNLIDLPKLRYICNNCPRQVLCFQKLKLLQVKQCDNLVHLFSSSTASCLVQLQQLCVEHCSAMKKIIVEDGDVDNRVPQVSSLQNLKFVRVKNCDSLMYLFPSSFVLTLLHLQELRLEHCDMMEGIVTAGEGVTKEIAFPQITRISLLKLPKLTSFYLGQTPEKLGMGESNTALRVLFNEKVSFPSLEDLDISNLDTVEKIWHDEFIADSFGKLKRLSVVSCQKMPRLIPSNMLKKLSSLQSLKIMDCNLVEEVFDMEALDRKESHDIPALQLRELCLESLNNLKYIWNKAPKGLLSHPNLKSVRVFRCPTFKIPFPGYVIRSLMQVIEPDMNSPAEKDTVAHEDVAKVVAMFLFPAVTSLERSRLNELKYFYFGLDTLEWSTLKKLDIESCESLEILASKLDKTVEQPIFLCGKAAFPSLETMNVSLKVEGIQHLHLLFGALFKLKTLIVENCPFVLNLFSLDFIKSLKSLENLTVKKCHQLQGVFNLNGLDHGEGEYAELLSKLKQLNLIELPELKSICYNNPPHVLLFQNLKWLQVKQCHSLTHLFSSSMVLGLKELQDLCIEHCDIMEEIATAKEGVTEEVTFPQITRVALLKLPKLTSFYRSHTPEQICTRDSNTAHGVLFSEKVSFPSLKDLDISNLDTVEKIWHDEFIADSFGKLTRLSVVSCQKMLRIIPSNMLKKPASLQSLKIMDCNLVEEVFDMGAIDRKESHDIPALQLRELCLESMKNLKYIWNKAPQGLLTYQNLKFVQVSHCPSLKIPFPGYMVRSLLQVKKLDMNSRSVEKIVAQEDVAKVATMFLFPELTSLERSPLTELKHFYFGLDTSEWAILKTLEIESCESLEILASKLDKTVGQPIFLCEKVSFPSLEDLGISNLDTVEKIWQDEFIADSFGKLKRLSVVSCQKMPRLIPSNMLKKLSSLQSLKIMDCNLVEEVFNMEAMERKESHDIPAFQLRELCLESLKNLKYIWNKAPQGFLTYPNLKSVQVSCCPSLKIPFPGYVVRSLLQVKEPEMNSHAVKDIVAYEDVAKVVTMFLFPEVTSLESSRLNELKHFYLGLDTLEWSTLKTLEIESCESLEMLAFKLDKTVKQPIFLCGKVAFPKLEFLNLSIDVKEIQHLDLLFEPLPNLKTLKVENCPFMLNLFSSDFVKGLTSLQNLTMQKCEQLQIVFDLNGLHHAECQHVEVLSRLEDVKLIDLPELKSIFKNSPPKGLCFPNLKWLGVKQCGSLTHLFPSSMALGLSQLQDIRVEHCSMVEQIVMAEEGVIDKISFPQITGITLLKLPKLESFYQRIWTPGVLFNEEVSFPQLVNLNVSGLDNVKGIWHNKLLEDSFGKLKRTEVENCKELQRISSSIVLNCLPSLEFLKVARCAKLTEVFSLKVINVQEDVTCNRLDLVLDDLQMLEHICNKVLGKKLCIQNLKSLKVHNCGSMKWLFSIYMESKIEKEITRQVDAAEVVIDKIEFPELTSLSLKSLHSLECFFPGSHDTHITVLFDEKVAFPCLESLEISDLPNMKKIWYNNLMDNSFGKLEKVKVEKCNKLPNVLSSNVLKELPRLHVLRIASCHQLKEVFDLEGAFNILEDETATKLNQLVLHDLLHLEHIWNKDPYGILTFQNLDLVEVYGCQLTSHFPSSSLFRNLSQFEKQLIRSRGTPAFGEKDEGEGFVFPQVTFGEKSEEEGSVFPEGAFGEKDEGKGFICPKVTSGKLLDLRKSKGKEVMKVDDDVSEISEDMGGSSG